MTDDTRVILDRIAAALERIADAMESAAPSEGNVPLQGRGSQNDYASFNVAQERANGYHESGDDLSDGVGQGYAAVQEPALAESDPITDFLASKGIQIKTVPEEDAADDVINSLAEFLGDRYNALEGVLSKIKRNMQQGGVFSASIKDYSQQEISDICQFCTRLHDIAFLEDYTYFKSPKYLIKAKTTTLPAAQNFFSGQWLERYVLLKAHRAVQAVEEEVGQALAFSYLLNPQVVLENGNDFELDLMFHVEGALFWIEAKSGHYQQHISKYARMSRMMGLDTRHAIIVLTDAPAEKTHALSALFGMTVYTLGELETGLIDNIRIDLGLQ